jgi:hypothetical protein
VTGIAGLVGVHVRQGHPDFLDLPWDLPLAEWGSRCERLVEMPRGLSRHTVVFLGYGSSVYAFKELATDAAEEEFDLLRRFEEKRLPAVMAVGHARSRIGPERMEASILITRFEESSLPYRTLFMHPGLMRYRERLMDAMASLLVRLHLAGAYWGDCSLSNTLFRRDAGELQAFLVDAETSEIHDDLSDGLRKQDILIMQENVAGELADLAAQLVEHEQPASIAPPETGQEIRARYERLWDEVRREVAIRPGERFRIHERIRALNELGFSVSEVELIPAPGGEHLRMRTIVTDRDYHRHMLHSLTGIVAGDHQASLMLNEIREMRATLSQERNQSVPMSVAAYRWQSDRYEPALRRLSKVIEGGGDAPEVYCQVLEHKWFMSEKAKDDVGLDVAMEDYLKRFAKA